MKNVLYPIAAGMRSILESDEITDETFAMLENLNMGLEEVTPNVILSARNDAAMIPMIDAEIARLQALKAAYSSRSARKEKWVLEAMVSAQRDKIESPTLTINIHRNPPSLKIDNEAIIPARFVDVIPATTKINTKALKDALKNGEKIEGARLESGVSLKVK